MSDISFTVWKDPDNLVLPQTYYFDLDDQSNPIKLGDGSFGIVFRVRKVEKEKTRGEYAVKIFHSDETMLNRFKVELEFWDEIKRVAEAKKIPESELISIVKPLGGTSSFHESPAYKSLFKRGGMNLKISSYAIVMDRYDATLKDLLENKKSELGKEHGDLSGYEILKKIKINDRVKYILPFIKDCISGLKTLYTVSGNAHLDLKPANLFYKLKGDTFDIAIADMGCLRPVYHDPGTSMTMPLNEDTRRKQLLGTINYRSPEQKDFQEICDGKVQHTVDGAIEILIQDPKFNDSIIEEGDLVFFSKSNDPIPFIIQKFERPEITGQEFTRIILQGEERTANIMDDEKTQIVIHKLQQIRTDLFGIGAITYDLITCGKSPERFYERLRIWDDKHNSIDKIMERYRRLVNDNFSEPQSKHVFESLNFNGRYAPEKIVKFILKCMLYHSPGNYYDYAQHNNQEIPEHIYTKEQIILSQLQKDFKNEIEPEKKDGGLGPVVRTDNPLISKNIPDTTLNPDELLSISSVLKVLQQCPGDKNASRLMLAYHYIDLLFEFTNKIFEDEKYLYFAEFNPENIRKITPEKNGKDKHDQLKYLAFPKKEDYYNALKDYELQIKIKTDPNSFFIPLELVHIYRPIVLLVPEEIKEPHISDNIFNFHFAHRSFPYDQVKEGDWILVRKKESPLNELYQITWVDNHTNLLKVSLFDVNNQKLNKNHKLQYHIAGEIEKDELLYYKNIDRGAYYLQILGVYIHQLFFLGLHDANEVSIPPVVDIVNIESAHRTGKKFTCLDAYKIVNKHYPDNRENKSNPERKELFSIYAELVNIYAKLVLRCLTNSYYKPSDKETRSIMSDIRESLYHIRTKIENALHLEKYALRSESKFIEFVEKSIINIEGYNIPIDNEYQTLIETANHHVQNNFPMDFDFENILEEMIATSWGRDKKEPINLNYYLSKVMNNIKSIVQNKVVRYVAIAVGAISLLLYGFLKLPYHGRPDAMPEDNTSVIDSLNALEAHYVYKLVEAKDRISNLRYLLVNSSAIYEKIDSIDRVIKPLQSQINTKNNQMTSKKTELRKIKPNKRGIRSKKQKQDSLSLNNDIKNIQSTTNKLERELDANQKKRNDYLSLLKIHKNGSLRLEEFNADSINFNDSLIVIRKKLEKLKMNNSNNE